MTVQPQTHNRRAQGFVASTTVPFDPVCHFKFFPRYGPSPDFPAIGGITFLISFSISPKSISRGPAASKTQ